MTRKEKILAGALTLSMLLLIASSIFTLYQNKPENSEFFIEKVIKSFNPGV